MFEFVEWQNTKGGDYAVIGDPIEHSLSPQIQQAALEATGIEASYERVRVPLAEFAEAMDHFIASGFKGMNVTVPLKERAFEMFGAVDDLSARIGAVNTVNLLTRQAVNTDAPGFAETLSHFAIVPPGPALILGAGGAARSVAVALEREGFELWIWSRSLERAEKMIGELEIEACILGEPDPSGSELIVNSTSAGLTGDSPPVLWERLEDGAFAYDLMYGRESKFLTYAAEHGAKVTDGLPMLVAQAALAFEWWFDQPAPRDSMAAAIR